MPAPRTSIINLHHCYRHNQVTSGSLLLSDLSHLLPGCGLQFLVCHQRLQVHQGSEFGCKCLERWEECATGRRSVSSIENQFAVESVFKLLSTHQPIYESHAQSIGSLVQFHYKHHTQVIRKGRDAGGGYRERKLTPTNTSCRRHRHPNPQKTHTQGLSMGCEVLLCKGDKQKHAQLQSYPDTHKHMLLTRACRCHTHPTVKTTKQRHYCHVSAWSDQEAQECSNTETHRRGAILKLY